MPAQVNTRGEPTTPEEEGLRALVIGALVVPSSVGTNKRVVTPKRMMTMQDVNRSLVVIALVLLACYVVYQGFDAVAQGVLLQMEVQPGGSWRGAWRMPALVTPYL